MRKWSILLAVAGLLCCTGCIITPLKHRPEAAEPIKIGLLLTASSEQAPQYRRLRAGVVFAAEASRSSVMRPAATRKKLFRLLLISTGRESLL